MEIILLEKIGRLGSLGDKVNVKAGHARNFLIPKGKAILATKEKLVEFEQRRAELERKNAEQLANAQQRAEKLGYISLIIPVKIHDEGKLFGSIGTKEIADAITKKGVEIKKSEVVLPNGAIREVGEYSVNLILHSDVTASIKVTVVAEETPTPQQ